MPDPSGLSSAPWTQVTFGAVAAIYVIDRMTKFAGVLLARRGGRNGNGNRGGSGMSVADRALIKAVADEFRTHHQALAKGMSDNRADLSEHMGREEQILKAMDDTMKDVRDLLRLERARGDR